MRKDQSFHNPVLSGFYPDPSICRVENDYYMVNSSFAYFPGLPIFHSRDLVHWEQIGHCIHRKGQLNYQNVETSLGLWAPTVRYHEGMFYVINTFVSGGREVNRDNFIVTAKNPAGPWSDPVFIKGADGIDPSLFFEEDGSIWYTGNYIHPHKEYQGHHGIYLNELDPETFQLKGPRYILWDGLQSRSRYLEAPHLYKKDGWYYLMVAEGGTYAEHSVMVARCRSIDGEYEICPRNPIVTHRHLPLNSEISVVGHADILETQNGEWWMVLLGVRPYQGSHFNLGRETFLVPIQWMEDGWPLLATENGLVNERERLPQLSVHRLPLAPTGDHFEESTLSIIWNTIHPPTEQLYSLTERPGFLRLYLKRDVLHTICTPAFVGRRQQHKTFLSTCSMTFSPKSEQEEAGIAVLQDDRYNYSMTVVQEKQKKMLRLSKTEAGHHEILEEIELTRLEQQKADQTLYLTVQGSPCEYQFYYGFQESEKITVGKPQDAVLLSSVTNGGFTGVYLGMYATSNGKESDNHADFDWFTYEGTEE